MQNRIKSALQSLVGLIFLHLSLVAAAQDTAATVAPPSDTVEVVKKVPVKVKPTPSRDMGVFIAVSLENSPQVSGRHNAPFYGAGIEFEGFLAGAYATTGLYNKERTLIFPNNFNLLYAYGGAYIGRRVWSVDRVQVDLLFNLAKGNMLWERADNHVDFIEDRFYTWEPELCLSYSIIPLSRVFATVGYRKYVGLNLEQVEPADLEGVTVNLGFKFGIFTDNRK